MIVAIPTPGTNLESRVDSRFGRAVGFILYDTETGTYRHIENNLDALAPEGAGVQAARNLRMKNIGAVITGHCGPKAFRIFSEAGILVYSGVRGPISKAIEGLKSGELQVLSAADAAEHWPESPVS